MPCSTHFRVSLLVALAAVLVGPPLADAAVIAHYSFDSNYNDFSGNNRHGTATGSGVTISSNPGEFVFGGGAANFSAVRDWVSVPSQSFGSGTPYSISFWARDLAPASGSGGMVLGQPGNTNFFMWLDTTAGGMRWRSANSDANRQADFAFTRDDNWHHYAFLAGDFDGDSAIDDVRLYRDNAIVGTALNKLTGFIVDGIGEAYTSSSDFDFLGQIDEVWLFNETLTPSNIDFLYNYNVTAPEPASLALWLLGGIVAVAALRMRAKRGGR